MRSEKQTNPEEKKNKKRKWLLLLLLLLLLLIGVLGYLLCSGTLSSWLGRNNDPNVQGRDNAGKSEQLSSEGYSNNRYPLIVGDWEEESVPEARTPEITKHAESSRPSPVSPKESEASSIPAFESSSSAGSSSAASLESGGNWWDDMSREPGNRPGNIIDWVTNRQIESLYIKQMPDQTEWIEEQEPDLTGMIIMAKFSHGADEEVRDYSVTHSTVTLNEPYIQIGYVFREKLVTVDVPFTVRKKQLLPDTVEVVGVGRDDGKGGKLPGYGFGSPCIYIEGQTPDTGDFAITGEYDNGKRYPVVAGRVEPDRPLTMEDHEITVVVKDGDKEYEITVPIQVEKKHISELVIVRQPNRNSYIEEQPFEKEGMVVHVKYNNGVDQKLVEEYQYTPSGLVLGQERVWIHYTEESYTVSADTPVNVRRKVLTGAVLKKPPTKTVYIEETVLEPSGIVIERTYDNGMKHDTTYVNSSDTEFAIGDQESVVWIEEYGVRKEISVPVQVIPKTPVRLIIRQMPSQSEYIQDTFFKPEGLALSVFYDNGKTHPVTGFHCDIREVVLGDPGVEVQYTENGKTVTTKVPVAVLPRTPISIQIKNPPNKTSYINLNQFDGTGATAEITYDNGKMLMQPITEWPEQTLRTGMGKAFIYYVENDVTVADRVSVNVRKERPVSITVEEQPDKLAYTEYDKFTVDGCKIRVHYDNNVTTVVLPVTDSRISVSRPSGSVIRLEDTDFVLRYTEDGITKSTAQNFTVQRRTPVSMAVTKPPSKTSYINRNKFDGAGTMVTVEYDNATHSEETYIIWEDTELVTGQTAKEITYTYNETTVRTNTPVTVRKERLTGISIETPPTKTEYTEYDNFQVDGCKILADYDNDISQSVIPITDSRITISRQAGSSVLLGDAGFIVSYTEDGVTKSTEQSFSVQRRTPVSMTLKAPPAKSKYINRNKFDGTGIKAVITYDNGTESLESDVDWDDTELTTGQITKEVRFTYNGETVKTNAVITVRKEHVTAVSVKSAPDKTSYIEVNPLALSGLTLTVEYDNGYHKEKDFEKDSGITSIPENGAALSKGLDAITIIYTEDEIEKTTTQPISVVAKTPIALQTEKAPNKVRYIEYDVFQPAGMVVQAVYDNGQTLDIADYTYPTGALSFGSTQAALSYTENGRTVSTSQPITVIRRTPVSMTLRVQPSKSSYINRNKFDGTGMKAIVTYNNGTESLEAGVDWDDTELTTGQTTKEIRFTYNGGTVKTNAAITVRKEQATAVSVSGAPAKTSYIEVNPLDLAGLKLTVKYDNGYSKEKKFGTDSGITSSPANGAALSKGLGTVAITYTEDGIAKTTTQSISVVAKKPVALRTGRAPNKVNYIEYDTFQPTGMIVQAVYNNGQTLEVAGYTYPTGALSLGSTQATLSYTENGQTVSTSQPISVTRRTPVSMALRTQPSKSSYINRNKFDGAGMRAVITYNNGTQSEETVLNWDDTELVTGQTVKEVRFGYNGATVKVNAAVSVRKEKLTGVAIKTAPSKTSYIEVNTLNLSGLKLVASYDNGYSKEKVFGVDSGITSSPVNGVALSKGQSSISITYSEDGISKSVSQSCSVAAKSPIALRIVNKPSRTDYMAGAVFSTSGMTFQADYNNGQTLSVAGCKSPGGALALGTSSVSISYTENGATVYANQAITTHAQRAQYQRYQMTYNGKSTRKDYAKIMSDYSSCGGCGDEPRWYNLGYLDQLWYPDLTIDSKGCRVSGTPHTLYQSRTGSYAAFGNRPEFTINGSPIGRGPIQYVSPTQYLMFISEISDHEYNGGRGSHYYKDIYLFTIELTKDSTVFDTVTLTNGAAPDNAAHTDGFWYVKTQVENINGGWNSFSAPASLSLFAEDDIMDDRIFEEGSDAIYRVESDVDVMMPKFTKEEQMEENNDLTGLY